MTKIFVVIDSLITDENSWEPHFASLLQGYVESSNLDYLVQENLIKLRWARNIFGDETED